MVAVNPPGQPAYTAGPLVNPATGATVVDPVDLVTPSVPFMNLALAPSPDSAGGYLPVSTQMLTAILMEMRVNTALWAAQIGPSIDLAAMRADEAAGASGGVIA